MVTDKLKPIREMFGCRVFKCLPSLPLIGFEKNERQAEKTPKYVALVAGR